MSHVCGGEQIRATVFLSLIFNIPTEFWSRAIKYTSEKFRAVFVEGDQEWLSEQLSKVMQAASSAIGTIKSDETNNLDEGKNSASSVGSLASYLKGAGAESKQVQRFLATAGWLYRRGKTSLTTAAVSSALAEHHQKRLGNPADCLNQNVAKGYCEKQKDGFFITPEGWSALGEQQT